MNYLINLDRRPDRLKAATAELNRVGIPFTRFAAVDALNVNVPSSYRAPAGAWGCRLSHIAVLRDALEHGYQEVTVFEDDIVFVKDYQTQLATFLAAVPDSWDCLFLGGQHVAPPIKVNDHVFRCVNCHRTHAYRLRGDYIKTVLGIFESCEGHIDHAFGDYCPTLNAYAPAPFFLVGQTEGVSDISSRRNQTKFWTPRRVQTPRQEQQRKRAHPIRRSR